ncbi:adenylate kinase [Candidatus Pelagibacter sp. FZCC0015]|uniref:adenylate kinase n=1 Tax=Candidatus Pelagibacter sp. FZCC0015 TaxID=2268451 RepID=UPI0011AAFA92|nr:adenylate kinase [Candidatus Pelagibacter sp. FZCC0015]
MNIILFGPPGAGKGTQSKYLVNKLNAFQISTGDLLREEIKKNSDIGKAITNDMKNGKFISDNIVNKLIENLISDPQKKNKLIFDGYPRSLSQAKNLEVLLKNSNQSIDLILFLNVDKEIILKRLEKRKIIENRSDDDSHTIVKRYEKYMETTQPVLNFYSENPNFKEIDGSLEIEEITRKIDTFINV